MLIFEDLPLTQPALLDGTRGLKFLDRTRLMLSLSRIEYVDDLTGPVNQDFKSEAYDFEGDR